MPLTLARQRQISILPLTVALLSCHGINALSLHSQGMHPTVPSQTCLFWVVCHPSRTYLPKGLRQEPQIDLFPSPHHQTIPPLPLTSGPWAHHVLYWLGTGWWCLGLARASLSDMSKSLSAAHVSAVIWRLSVCVSWPFMWAFLWFFAPFRSWASYDDEPYISLAHF